MVIDEFVSELLAMLLSVLLDPLMVLFVSVCVVSVPTRVVVASGSVIVRSAVGSVTVSVVS